MVRVFMKVFAISDLHIDYAQNLQWLMNLSQTDYRDDILILAGDISDKRELLEQCFKKLSNCFKQVLYVPGNHDFESRRDCRRRLCLSHAATADSVCL